MLILTLRTDKPEAEIGLYDDDSRLTYRPWSAHRQLAESVHLKLKTILDGQGKSLQDLEAIVVYKGPGSFTGLRIGLSVANALADSLAIPAVGATGDEWIDQGIAHLLKGDDQKPVLPDYGAPVHITKPKK